MRLMFFLLFAMLACFVRAAELNDTGITLCASSAGANETCNASHPLRQDARHGRDALPDLPKTGGGMAGFDFDALDSAGNKTSPSTGATPHPCVRDNVTDLVWEVKTNDGGLRDMNWTYTWYDSVKKYSNDSYTGLADATDCLPGAQCAGCFRKGRCDTEKYVQDVNTEGICGYKDWRMPTLKELESIAHLGRNSTPAIDTNYFPNTRDFYWSSTRFAVRSAFATWELDFAQGNARDAYSSSPKSVRLVRGTWK